MAEAITFDTHRFVKNLTANGFTEAQAEALAEEQVHLLNSNLVTKTDLEKVRADLEVKIEAVKADILKWMVTALIAQTGLIVAPIRLL